MNESNQDRGTEQHSGAAGMPEPTRPKSDRSDFNIKQVKRKACVVRMLFWLLLITAMGVGIYAKVSDIPRWSYEAKTLMNVYWVSAVGSLVAGFFSFFYQLIFDETLLPDEKMYKSPGIDLAILLGGGFLFYYSLYAVLFYGD